MATTVCCHAPPPSSGDVAVAAAELTMDLDLLVDTEPKTRDSGARGREETEASLERRNPPGRTTH